jgi:hypothetical protein
LGNRITPRLTSHPTVTLLDHAGIGMVSRFLLVFALELILAIWWACEGICAMLHPRPELSPYLLRYFSTGSTSSVFFRYAVGYDWSKGYDQQNRTGESLYLHMIQEAEIKPKQK